MALDYTAYCDAIQAQFDLLREHLDGADLTVPVPSCPGWNVGQLARHVGGAIRWAAGVVDSRATEPVPEQFRDLSEYLHERPDVVRPWLAGSADLLLSALRSAGPGAPMWAPVPGGPQVSDFYARRMTHESAIHRVDAALALGIEYSLEKPIAIDTVDEWFDLACLPVMLEFKPHQRELLGAGRTIHLHATDVDPSGAAEWVIDLTGDVPTWRRAHEKCLVAARGRLVDLVLTLYGRRDPSALDVVGDAAYFDHWLGQNAFG